MTCNSDPFLSPLNSLQPPYPSPDQTMYRKRNCICNDCSSNFIFCDSSFFYLLFFLLGISAGAGKMLKYLTNDSKDLCLGSVVSWKNRQERGVCIGGGPTMCQTQSYGVVKYNPCERCSPKRQLLYTYYTREETEALRDLAVVPQTIGQKWYLNHVVCNLKLLLFVN